RHPAAASLSVVRKDRWGNLSVRAPGLCLSRLRFAVRLPPAVPGRIADAAGHSPGGSDAGCDRTGGVGLYAPDREFRRHDEFRHLPDVLSVFGALSALDHP